MKILLFRLLAKHQLKNTTARNQWLKAQIQNQDRVLIQYNYFCWEMRNFILIFNISTRDTPRAGFEHHGWNWKIKIYAWLDDRKSQTPWHLQIAWQSYINIVTYTRTPLVRAFPLLKIGKIPHDWERGIRSHGLKLTSVVFEKHSTYVSTISVLCFENCKANWLQKSNTDCKCYAKLCCKIK